MSTPVKAPPFVLVIRDGWGRNPNPEHDAFNAVKLARTPVSDRLESEYPSTLIRTSGEDVGLPDGTMGNSEVGHQNIGAGRVVPQESLVMTKACKEGLHTNLAIKDAVRHCLAEKGRSLHLLGINSDAGVHGLLEHLYAILVAAKKLGMPPHNVFIHLFTDGRDTGPFAGKAFAQQVESRCRELGIGRISSIVGRYYSMDRDHRWERVAQAYALLTGYRLDVGWDDQENAVEWLQYAPWTDEVEADSPEDASSHDNVHALAPVFATVSEAIDDYYAKPNEYRVKDSGKPLEGDEFVLPRIIAGSCLEAAKSRIKDGDSVIFYNYRGDRPRELSAAFCFPDSAWAKVKPSPDTGKVGFDRGKKLALHYVVMTEYWEALTPHVQGVAFPRPARMKNIAGEWLSSLGVTQFRCAETEKYPHVTFFFNDYREEPFPGERRENPPSPRVKTYDLKPKMSAEEVCATVLRRLEAPDGERVIIVNFANPDMVGHTGSLSAAIKACEAVDACVGRIVDATLARDGSLIVTADHGNAEQMFDPATNAPHTAHTTYPVPLMVVGARFKGKKLREGGRLADIMPTALAMMGLPQPPEMTGRSLLG